MLWLRGLVAASGLPMVLYTVLTFARVLKSAELLDRVGKIRLKPVGAALRSKALARRMMQMSEPLCSVPALVICFCTCLVTNS